MASGGGKVGEQVDAKRGPENDITPAQKFCHIEDRAERVEDEFQAQRPVDAERLRYADELLQHGAVDEKAQGGMVQLREWVWVRPCKDQKQDRDEAGPVGGKEAKGPTGPEVEQRPVALDAERDDEAADEEEGDDAGLAEIDGGPGAEERKVEAFGSVLQDDGQCSQAANGIEKLIPIALGGRGRGVSGGDATLDDPGGRRSSV